MTSNILPVFISFAGCRQKCIYCDQNLITGLKNSEIIQSAKNQIENYRKYSETWDEIAFFGGSFTCLPETVQKQLFDLADEAGIRKKRFSTSPDCVTDEIMSAAAENGVNTAEIGVQSLDDEVLRINKRPCSAEAAENAVKTAGKHIKNVICQLMTGMYGENFRSFASTADKIINLKPDGVRIYPCMVLKGTELEKLYVTGEHVPLTLSESLARSVYGLMLFEPEGIKVIRMGLQDTESLKDSIAAGEYHPAFKDMANTIVFSIFFALGLKIETDAKYLNTVYGYKSFNKKHVPDSIIIKKDAKPDIAELCIRIRESINEDYKRFIQRQAALYAERLICETHNG